MRSAQVLYKGNLAGILSQQDDGSFVFRYEDSYFRESEQPAISLTLPKSQQEYTDVYLFPFFYNMLPEGTNKEVICFENRLDKDDHFSILMTTARHDTIGAVQIRKIN
jgi:serine/threonine-protein kinase HipA